LWRRNRENGSIWWGIIKGGFESIKKVAGNHYLIPFHYFLFFPFLFLSDFSHIHLIGPIQNRIHLKPPINFTFIFLQFLKQFSYFNRFQFQYHSSFVYRVVSPYSTQKLFYTCHAFNLVHITGPYWTLSFVYCNNCLNFKHTWFLCLETLYMVKRFVLKFYFSFNLSK